jgi:hypothetical protein
MTIYQPSFVISPTHSLPVVMEWTLDRSLLMTTGGTFCCLSSWGVVFQLLLSGVATRSVAGRPGLASLLQGEDLGHLVATVHGHSRDGPNLPLAAESVSPTAITASPRPHVLSVVSPFAERANANGNTAESSTPTAMLALTVSPQTPYLVAHLTI